MEWNTKEILMENNQFLNVVQYVLYSRFNFLKFLDSLCYLRILDL